VFLADTSIWAWAKRDDGIAEKLGSRLAQAELATCVPIALEVLHSAGDGSEYEEDLAVLAPLQWLPLTGHAADRALELQHGLASTTHGAHRIPTIDYFIAALAEEAGPPLVLWHLDSDLARLCEFTGQAHEPERLVRRRRPGRS
jgi:predicted nucleic acid-binding protein